MFVLVLIRDKLAVKLNWFKKACLIFFDITRISVKDCSAKLFNSFLKPLKRNLIKESTAYSKIKKITEISRQSLQVNSLKNTSKCNTVRLLTYILVNFAHNIHNFASIWSN